MRDIFSIKSFRNCLLFLCLNSLNSLFRKNIFHHRHSFLYVKKIFIFKIQTMTSEIIRKVKNEITGLKNVTEFKSLKMPVYIYFIHTI